MSAPYSTHTFAINLFQYGYIIVIPIISLIGFLLNGVCIIVFSNRNLKEKIHFYLMTKSFIEMLLLAIFVFIPYDSCIDCASFETYGSILFSMWINGYLGYSLHLFDSIIEIVITINRFFIIKSSEKILANIKDKIFIFICGFISMIIFVPNLFLYEIESYKTKEGTQAFYLEQKNSDPYLLYFINNATAFVDVITLLILLPVNIAVIVQFKRFIDKKNRLTISNLIPIPQRTNVIRPTKKRKTETKFNKMILLVSFLFILVRIGEIIPYIFLHSIRVDDPNFDPNISNDMVDITSIIKIFSQFISCIIISANFFVYYSFNTPFKVFFFKLFLCKNLPQT